MRYPQILQVCCPSNSNGVVRCTKPITCCVSVIVRPVAVCTVMLTRAHFCTQTMELVPFVAPAMSMGTPFGENPSSTGETRHALSTPMCAACRICSYAVASARLYTPPRSKYTGRCMPAMLACPWYAGGCLRREDFLLGLHGMQPRFAHCWAAAYSLAFPLFVGLAHQSELSLRPIFSVNSLRLSGVSFGHIETTCSPPQKKHTRFVGPAAPGDGPPVPSICCLCANACSRQQNR